MTKQTTTNTQIDIQSTLDSLSNTSAKIRWMVQYHIDQNHTKPIAQSEKDLFKYNVRTKDGMPIRYQYIRNIWNQHVSK